MPEHKRLGDCLVKANIIKPAQLAEALTVQKQEGGFLGEILLARGWISDKQLCQAISEALHVNCVSIDNVLIGEDILALVPESLAVTCKILPLFVHAQTLYLAMENPRDASAIQMVEFNTGMTVKPLMVPPCQLREMLKKYYHFEEAPPLAPAPAAVAEKARPNKPVKSPQPLVDVKKVQLFQRKRLGDLLVDAGLINQVQLAAALQAQKTKFGFLGKILIDLGWATEQQVCQVMAQLLHVNYLREEHFRVTPEIVALVPESLAASCNIFPLAVKRKVLYLAMENPLDSGTIQLLEFSTGLRVEPVIAPPSQLQTIIRKYYPQRKLSSNP